MEKEGAGVDVGGRSTSGYDGGEKGLCQVKENVEVCAKEKSTSSRTGVRMRKAKGPITVRRPPVSSKNYSQVGTLLHLYVCVCVCACACM